MIFLLSCISHFPLFWKKATILQTIFDQAHKSPWAHCIKVVQKLQYVSSENRGEKITDRMLPYFTPASTTPLMPKAVEQHRSVVVVEGSTFHSESRSGRATENNGTNSFLFHLWEPKQPLTKTTRGSCRFMSRLAQRKLRHNVLSKACTTCFHHQPEQVGRKESC